MDPNLPPCCYSDNFDALDQQLYAAYNRGGDPTTAGLNFRGDPCPTWFELPENVRAKWGEASTAARDWQHPMITVTARSDFGAALDSLRAGKRVCRAGWNGKGMWLALHVPDDACMMGHPYVYMSDVTGRLFPWSPNQLDMLAEDWQVAVSP